VIPCPGVSRLVEDGGTVETDLATGEVRNPQSGETLHYRPLAERMIEIWQAGSLAAALKNRLSQQG
jgi:hypothetical protein